jgi:hypothetical protein
MMGFFKVVKKYWRGVKKVFKKIGRGIKKVFMGIGKFMNKIGIVGQIAIMFLMPYLGPLVGAMFKTAGGFAATALQAMGPVGNAILKGAKFVIGKAGKFATGIKNTFKTVTEGVTNFMGEFTKTALNKIGFDPTKFGFTPGGNFDAWVKSGKGTFGEAWDVVQGNITENAGKILDPWKKSIDATTKTTLEGLSDSSYNSVENIKKMNPQIKDWKNISGQTINLDMDNIAPLPKYTGSNLMGDLREQAAVDFGMLEESVTGGPVYSNIPGSDLPEWENLDFPSTSQSLIDEGLPRPTTESLARWQEEGKFLKAAGSTAEPTAQNWIDFNKKLMKEQVEAAAGGGSLLSRTASSLMPTGADVAKQTAVTGLSQMALDAIAGPEPPYSPYPTVVYGEHAPSTAVAPINFVETSYAQTGYNTDYRDSAGIFGGQDWYGRHKALMGMG